MALDGLATPEDVIHRLADRSDLVCLAGEWAGGSILIAWKSTHEVTDEAEAFLTLDALPQLAVTEDACTVGGGWFGYLGYPSNAVDDMCPSAHTLPPVLLRFYPALLRYSTRQRQWFFECLWSKDTARDISQRFAEASALVRDRSPARAHYELGVFAVDSPHSHMHRVEDVIHRIHSGDLFQANVCTKLSGDFEGSSAALFSAGINTFSPDFAALIQTSDGGVVSLSPELFLRRKKSSLLAAPIKGTRPRADDPLQDRQNAEVLAESRKDSAENLMIVDLMRNDLSRTAQPNSVKCDKLLSLEAHPNVWHLVSYVSSTVGGATSTGDILRSVFPPGSVTGAPKHAAMQACHEVEGLARQVYTGSIGYVSPLGDAEFNVVIRTFEIEGNTAWVGTGGGITANSDPRAEWAECLTKVVRLIGRLGGEVRTEPVGNPHASAACSEVFDTALCVDGVIIDRQAHEWRLTAACEELWGRAEPLALIAPPIGATKLLRVRTSVHRKKVRSEAESIRSNGATAPLSLLPQPMAKYDYHIKAADRAAFDDAEQATPESALPLFLDADGYVLETSRSNVFIVRGSELWTPATEGRILSGVTRRRVLLLARERGIKVQARRMTLDDVSRADSMFTTGSIAGITPVREVIGAATFPTGCAITSELQRAYEDWTGRYIATVQILGDLRQRLQQRNPPGRSRVEGRSVQDRRGIHPSLLLIDNYDSFSYNLVHYLRSEGALVDVMLNDDPREVVPSNYDGLVLSPGPGSPNDAGRCTNLIRDFAEQEVPILGVCLGHQCIGIAFGGSLDAASWPQHGMASRIWHDGSALFSGLPQGFLAARYHSLTLLPSNLATLRVTAVSDDDVIMAVEHQKLPVYGVQFHPESILTTHGRSIIQNFLDVVCERLMASLRKQITSVTWDSAPLRNPISLDRAGTRANLARHTGPADD